MAADRHVVGVEWLAVHIIGNALLHELKIRLGPVILSAVCFLRLEPVSGAMPVIAHIRMGEIPAIVGITVIVVAIDRVAKPL